MAHESTTSFSFSRGALMGAALACALGLAACDQNSSSTTAGQKVDAAIEKTRETASEVKAEAKTALNDAERRIDQNAPRVEAGARDAGAAVKQTADDVAITAQVSAALAKDPDLSAIKINVDTNGGAVVLNGPAPSEAARMRASEIAKGVTGVVSVDNRLMLKAG